MSCAAGLVKAQTSPPDTSRPAQRQYTGPGSCSSTACHGSVEPRADNRVWQNEYSIWVLKDKHSRAYSVLGSDLSQRMARHLGLKQRAPAAPECLACHALYVPPAQRARTFELDDGVSCESCHGPAAEWLGEHTKRDWTHQQSVQRGMWDTKDLARRTEVCLSCHLGTAEKSVTHEMLAAGHPDLIFELDAFSALLPRHWKEPGQHTAKDKPEDKEANKEKDPWWGVRTWSVGQAVQLRQALERLARRAGGPNWPEYAEFDCYACHHPLTPAKDSWRQQSGYPGRRPGTPAWDASRYALLLVLARDLAPLPARDLESKLAQVAQLANRLDHDRQQLATAALACSEAAGGLAGRLKSHAYQPAQTVRLMRSIAADADALSHLGERTAEQTAMALNSLFLAYDKYQRPPNRAQVQAAIAELFKQLENPSYYQPRRFAEQVKRIGQLLPTR